MIQTDPEDIERIRARIRKMTDLELRKEQTHLKSPRAITDIGR
jgi:hypothetical protein